MEIGALKAEDFQVWMPFADAEVLVRYISLEELREIGRKATRVTWEGPRTPGNRPVETLDSALANKLLGRAAVRGWRGITMEGEEFPYSPENCDFLMARWLEFVRFVNEASLDLRALQEEERERMGKASGLTSGQEGTTRA
jgi:hypothetical protein